MKIINQELSDQTIVIDDKKGFSFIGDGTVLRNCQIRCEVNSKALSLDGSTLIDCTFSVAKQLKSFSWLRTRLVRTKLEGKFPENEFGHLSMESEFGQLEASDFSGAEIDGCQFFECDLQSISFPSWPCAIVLDPHDNGPAMASSSELDALRTYGNSFQYCDENVRAIAIYSYTLEKEYGVSPAEVKEFFARLDFVSF